MVAERRLEDCFEKETLQMMWEDKKHLEKEIKNLIGNRLSLEIDLEETIKKPETLKKTGRRTRYFTAENRNYICLLLGNMYHEEIEKETETPGHLLEIAKQLPENKKRLLDSEGIFLLIVYDRENKEIYLVNDKLGLYPAYVYEGEKWLLATSVETLARKKIQLSKKAMSEFLVYGFLLDGKTFLEKTRQMPPASIWKIGNGIEKRRYHEFIIEEKSQLEEKIGEIKTAMQKAVGIRARGNPVCTRLTGGWDTRFILANLLEEGKEIIAYTSKDSRQEDLWISKMLVRRYGLVQCYCKPGMKLFNGLLGGQVLSLALQPSFLNRINEKNIQKKIQKIKIKDKKHRETYFYLTNSFRSHLNAVMPGWAKPAEKFFLYHEKFPFLDSDLLKVVWSIDSEELKNNRGYHEIYKQIYPEMLEIPWTTTESPGRPEPPAYEKKEIQPGFSFCDLVNSARYTHYPCSRHKKYEKNRNQENVEKQFLKMWVKKNLRE